MIALCLGLLVATAPASTARDHFVEGTRLYQAGRWHEAAEELRAAYELLPDPRLALDLAQALRHEGRDAAAVHYYRLFLDARPASPEAGLVRGTIAFLEARAPPAPAAVIQRPPPVGAERPRWPVYGAASLAAASFVAAAVFGVLAQNASQTLLSAAHPGGVADGLVRTTQRDSTVANVLYGVGGVAAAATGVLVVWDLR